MLKTTTFSRAFAALLFIPAMAAEARAESDPWTVEDAVGRALANPDLDTALEAALRAARAEVAEATVVPNPALGFTHEQVLGDDEVASLELSVMVEQRFDLSGWRDALRDALPHRQAALGAERDARRLEIAVAVHEAFFQVRYQQARAHVLAEWVQRLERGAASIAARRQAGDASPYDVKRAQRELDIAGAERGRVSTQLAAAWADLRTLVPWEATPTLSGALTPARPTATDAVELPDHARLRHLQRALTAEMRAWDGPFWRDWTVGAGYRFADVEAATGHGFLISLSLPLAFRDTDASRVTRLEASHARLGSELRLRRTLAERAERAAHDRLGQALDILGRIEATRDGDLVQLAEAAYAGGEATLAELLDAYSSETRLKLSLIDLQWEARRASTELQRRRGHREGR